MNGKQQDGGKVISLAAAKKKAERKEYSALVLRAWDDTEHEDKRKTLDLKAQVQIKARERL